MNDLKVNESCVKITSLARTLSHVQAEAKDRPSRTKLAILLSDIQRAAEEAQWRLNDIESWEQMGT